MLSGQLAGIPTFQSNNEEGGGTFFIGPL